MNYYSIIFSAAKAAKVSGLLLYAICGYESNDFTQTYVAQDHGSASVGICMVKLNTAQMLGFKGNLTTLQKPEENAKYAALYLQYQQDRYGSEDWCKLAASYNSGTFVESKKRPGKPRNLEYVKRVQKKLAEDIRDRLSCDKD